MRLTLVHPAIGRRAGRELHAHLADGAAADRGARRPHAAGRRHHASTTTAWRRFRSTSPTDLVAIPVETYTAKRAYQIASEYRRRGVPVVMGGFHATLVPDEVDATTPKRGGGRGGRALAAGDRRCAPRPAASRSIAPTSQPALAPGALRPAAVSRPALSAHRPGRDRARLPVPVRVLRGADVLRAHRAASARSTPSSPSSPSSKPDKRLFFFVDDNFAADLSVRARACRGAGAAQHPLGHADEHQRRARRGVSRGAGAQRLPRRADRLREPRRERAARHAQDLQHHARRLCAGAGEPAPARHPRLRHVRLRL